MDEGLAGQVSGAEELIALDAALDRLDAVDPELRKVVELRYFGGLPEKEIATLLGVTGRTVRRHWTRARAWLHRELSPDALSENA